MSTKNKSNHTKIEIKEADRSQLQNVDSGSVPLFLKAAL
jgi:hypothetical protein